MTRNGPSALALPATFVTAMLWMVVACATGGSTGSTATPAAPSHPVASASHGTSQPAASFGASSAIDNAVSPAAQPDESSSLDPNAPPPGTLTVAGQSIVGLIGSYCWHANGAGQCADAPPFTDRQPDLPVVTVAATGTQLQFNLAGGYPFAAWSASYLDDNGNLVSLGSSTSSFDPDAAGPSITPVSMASFPAPPAVDQSIVEVFVRFADGGDASYGWSVTVQ